MQTGLLLLITVIGWALFHNFVKLASHHLPTPAMQIVSAICWCTTIPLYVSLLNKTPHKWSLIGIGWCVAAFISTSVGTYAYLQVVSKNDVSKVVAIATSYPIITVLVSIVFMNEVLTWQKVVGLLLVLSGVFVSSR